MFKRLQKIRVVGGRPAEFLVLVREHPTYLFDLLFDLLINADLAWDYPGV